MKLLRCVPFFCGIMLIVVAAVLNSARQAKPISTGLVFTKDFGQGYHIYRRWRGLNFVDRLTAHNHRREIYSSLTWSPDGKWIAYIDYSLFLLPANGGDDIPLTDSFDGSPTWSPDSQWIAFSSYRTDNWDIFVLPADGSGVARQITHAAADDFAPLWSPDGEWIAFFSLRDSQPEIYRVHPDGSGEENITNTPGVTERPALRWSQDGQWLVFDSDQTEDYYVERIHEDGTERNNVLSDNVEIKNPAAAPIINLHWRALLMLGVGVVLVGTGSDFFGVYHVLKHGKQQNST